MTPQDEVRTRLKRYRVTRDARVLWPELTPRAFQSGVREIARVSAAVLGDEPATARLDPPDGLSPTTLGVAGFASGIGPLLGHWIETGRITADPAIASLFATHLDHGRKRAARLRRELEALLPEFSRHGIEVAVLKGMHTAYRYFPEPGTRPAADIDLLVGPADCERARRLLRGLGFVESETKDLPLRSHWSPPGANGEVRSLTVTHVENPWAVDLHATLDRAFVPGSPVGFGPFELSTGEVWSEFARPVRVLPQPLLLAYLALHASSHFPGTQLVHLVELVLVTRRDFGRAGDWSAFDSLLERTGTRRYAFPALELVERLVPGTVPHDVRRRLTLAASWPLRRRVARTPPATPPRFGTPRARDRLVWVGSPRDALACLAHLLWPRGEARPLPLRHAAAHYGRRLRRLLYSTIQRLVPR